MATLEVLVTTMNATGFEKYFEMNLQTDAIIANQADYCSYEETVINGHIVKLITTNTKGASINRNIAISYASADLIMFADDDMNFVDGYENLVMSAFNEKKRVDIILFASKVVNCERWEPSKSRNKIEKAKIHNIMSSGVWALCLNRKRFLKTNTLFPIYYGPGQTVSMGEDSIFLKELLKKSKYFYVSNTLLATINQETSTWFFGYTDTYFNNVGYLHSALYQKLAYLSTLRRSFYLSKSPDINHSLLYIYKKMIDGIHLYYKNE